MATVFGSNDSEPPRVEFTRKGYWRVVNSLDEVISQHMTHIEAFESATNAAFAGEQPRILPPWYEVTAVGFQIEGGEATQPANYALSGDVLVSMAVTAVLRYYSEQSALRTLYVNPSHPAASDSYDVSEVSSEQPWATLMRAVRGSSDQYSPNSSQAAQAGDLVLTYPGTYVGEAGGDEFDVTYNPVNQGTAANPIRFEAVYHACQLSDTDANRSIIQTVSSGGRGGAAIGANSRNYIIWEGFFLDENDILTAADTGPVVFFGTEGCQCIASRIHCIPVAWAETNHNAIRFQHSSYGKALDNKIDGVRMSNAGRGEAILAYSSHHMEWAWNTIWDCFEGCNPKGDNGGVLIENPFSIHHNHIFECDRGIVTGGIKSPSGTTEYCTVYQNIIHDCDSFGLQVITYDSISASHLRVVNNTMWRNGPSGEAHIYFSGTGSQTLVDSMFRNNILVAVNEKMYQSYHLSLAVYERAVWDNNAYHQHTSDFLGYNGGVLSFSVWRGRGNDANSFSADPQLTDPANGDFTLQAGSPCVDAGVDVLNLLGGGTSASINMGAHIGLGDEFGVRAAA